MKTSSKLILTLTLSISAMFLTSIAQADQVKGAQLLLNRPATAVAVADPVTPVNHPNCPACKDSTKMVKSTGRGIHQDVAVSQHACGNCSTKITTVGQGKQAHNVVSHTCDNGIIANCCK
jgi:hypothetical protein